jgi:threonine dehydrogenase-like Zn-dependent dehydrogenase
MENMMSASRKCPIPKFLNPRDAIVKITSTAICGSDLHLYDGIIPTMMRGDVLGHEFMGEVVELGSSVSNLKVGDRVVVVPFPIACGSCFFCKARCGPFVTTQIPTPAWPKSCLATPRRASSATRICWVATRAGRPNMRVCHTPTFGPVKVPESLTDEQVLFLTDIFPTGYMAAENCDITPGDTVAIWGCGPVGQFAIRSSFLLGAERVIAMDNVEERLKMARDAGAETINFDDVDLMEKLKEMTGGRGPDSCMDAVGSEGHGLAPGMIYDYAKQAMRLQAERPNVLRQAILACRKGGTVSVPGVYGGLLDKMPFGAFVNKGLTMKTGQTHVHRYLQPLMEMIENGKIDPSFVITHKLSLDEAPHGYNIFRNKKDGCIKVVLRPDSVL